MLNVCVFKGHELSYWLGVALYW